MKSKGILLLMLCSLFHFVGLSAQEESVKFGGFDSWITRSIKESLLVGGKTQTLYEVGPKGTFDGARPYTNQGGSPWGCSNIYAKVAGVVKTNVSVYPDTHKGGQCAKLYTHLVNCKAIGVVNISALASGSLFLGSIIEPITGTSNPMSKMSMGVPFTKKPKAVKFDYKFKTPGGERIRETGFSRRQKVAGKDMGQVTCLLQKRWEDAELAVRLKRLGLKRCFSLAAIVYHWKPQETWEKRLETARKDGRSAAELYLRYPSLKMRLRSGIHPLNLLRNRLLTQLGPIRNLIEHSAQTADGPIPQGVAQNVLLEKAYLEAGLEALSHL